MAVVLIPAPLRRLTGGASRIELEASSVADLLDRLDAAHPGVRSYLCDADGALRPYVNLFINSTEVRQLQGLATPLRATDEVMIIPAMAGGTEAVSSGVSAPATLRLPVLRIVPSTALLLHEEHDPERVERLVRALRADGVLRNPPVVATLGGGDHVVLDGANRVTALSQEGVPHQLAQIVDYHDPTVALEVWSHLLPHDGDVTAVVRAGAWRGLSIDAARAGVEEGDLACAVITRRGARGLPVEVGIAGRVAAMREVVAAYRGRGPIYRVQTADFDLLAREYGTASALVLFSRLSKGDIQAIARLPVKLPTGISRHIVPRRALRVNLDLSLLRSGESLESKQARLDEVIHERLLEHRVRHYPEATVLYDE
jgi:molybdopterin synthase sulfur carrier subunit